MTRRRACIRGTIASIVLIMHFLAEWRPASLHAAAMASLGQSTSSQPRSLKLMTWNVNGIRSFFKTASKRAQLEKLLATEQPDITFLQEHRLQEKHIGKEGRQLLDIFDAALPDRAQHKGVWACSTARLGYSGSCAIFHDKAGVVHHAHGEVDDVDLGEGRSVRLDLDCGLSVVGAYVPNSMSDLKRLDYRTTGWDKSMQKYLEHLSKQGKNGKQWHAMLCGDLNVAHEDVDFHNSADKRTQKQPGTTLEERRSFGAMLKELGMADTWRSQYPDTKRAYTFWSARTKARNGNRGMRLDYFLAPQKMLPYSWRKDDASSALDEEEEPCSITVQHTAILPEVTASDHCPVVCTLHLH